MHHRTLRRALVLPAAAGLVLAGCADGDSDDSASGEQCITSTDIQAVSGGEQGGSGLTTPGPAQPRENTGQTFTIGFEGGLTGASPQLAINARNGVELAIEHATGRNNLPFNLEFTAVDDRGVPDGAPAAAQNLIDDPDVIAVLGPIFSGPTSAAGPLYDEAGLAFVSPSATNPDLAEQGFETFSRVIPTDQAQGEQAAQFLASHADRVYVIDDTTTYGVGLADQVQSTLSNEDVEVVRNSLPDTTSDYSAISQQVVNENVDAVYYAGYYQQFAPFAQALDAAGYECLAMSGDGSKDQELIRIGGDATNGLVLTCPCADAVADPRTQQFAADYQARFDTPPSTYSAEAYDAANVVIHAMANVDGDVTRQSVASEIRETELTGLTKTISFEGNGNVRDDTTFIYGVEDGSIVLKGRVADLVDNQ